MATIKDLINHIDLGDMEVQFMTRGECDLAIKGKKDKYLEAKFCAPAQNITKEAIIIWVDKQKLNSACDGILR